MDLVIGSIPLHRKVNGCPKGQSKSAICSDISFAGIEDLLVRVELHYPYEAALKEVLIMVNFHYENRLHLRAV